MAAKELYHIEKLGLTLVGVSLENHSLLYKIYSMFVIVVLFCFYPIVLLAGLTMQRFNEALEGWIMFVGYLMELPLLLITLYRRKKIRELLDQLADKSYVPSQEALDLVEQWLRRKNIKVLVFTIGLILSLFTQVSYCLYLRFTKSDPNEWKLGFGAIVLINTTYSPNYEIAFVYQNVSLFYGITLNLIVTIIITSVLDFAATQCQVLQLILSMPKYTIDKFVIYHIQVMNLIKNLENIFSQSIVWIFFGISVINCIEIYRVSLLPLQSINTIRGLVEMLTVCFQIFLICYAGETMSQESQKIVDAAYGIDFVGTDLGYQKALIIIMRQSRRPIRLKAGKLIEISLMNFALVMRASYSAYAMLKNVNG